MSSSRGITNLGIPVAVDVAEIERELTAFWKSASEQQGEAAVIRACACNVVVIVQDHREAEALRSILATVGEWHPSRSLIAYREEEEKGAADSGGPRMHAWVSTQCSAPFAGGPQICCEAITLRSEERRVGKECRL